MNLSVSLRQIERRIHVVRGHRVMLDADLAELYGVPTKQLNLSVRRNSTRFPADFMFQLSVAEAESLRFQIETSKVGRGGRRYLPLAFTEQGVAMLSSVLRSPRAIEANIWIMRAFVRMRSLVPTDRELARRLESLEKEHWGHRREHALIESVIRRLLEPPTELPEPPRRRIGFRVDRK